MDIRYEKFLQSYETVKSQYNTQFERNEDMIDKLTRGLEIGLEKTTSKLELKDIIDEVMTKMEDLK